MAHTINSTDTEAEQEILVLRFPSGEEIIGMISDDGHTYTVKTPLGIGIDQQQGRLVFIPFMPYTSAGQGFEISKSQTLFASVPVDSIRNDYLEATGQGSRIITPPPRTLLRPVK